LALGEHERAKEIAQRGYALASAAATRNLHGIVRSMRTLALAEGALGEHAAAARRLDEAIAHAAPFDSPLLSGSLHEARARVALAAGDSIAFHQHLAETEHLFRRSRNPALVGRAQRLAETALEVGRTPERMDSLLSTD